MYIVSDTEGMCTTASTFRVKPDILLSNCKSSNFSSIALIGGAGVHNYINSVLLKKMLKEFYSQHKVIAAICLAPLVLANAGLLQNKQVTAHQSAKMELIGSGARFIDSDVVMDGNIITASGAESVKKWAEMILRQI